MMPASKRSIAIINIASCVALLAPSWVVAIGHLHEHRFARRRPALMRRHFGSVSEREPGQRAGIGLHPYRPWRIAAGGRARHLGLAFRLRCDADHKESVLEAP